MHSANARLGTIGALRTTTYATHTTAQAQRRPRLSGRTSATVMSPLLQAARLSPPPAMSRTGLMGCPLQTKPATTSATISAGSPVTLATVLIWTTSRSTVWGPAWTTVRRHTARRLPLGGVGVRRSVLRSTCNNLRTKSTLSTTRPAWQLVPLYQSHHMAKPSTRPNSHLSRIFSNVSKRLGLACASGCLACAD